MNTILKLICLLLLGSCTKNQSNTFDSEKSQESEITRESAEIIHFEILDAHQYWGWLEPTIPSNDSIERFMFESDQDQIVQITEQLHAAKSILDENPDSLPEMEWLEYQFFTHMYLSSIYRKSTTGTSRDSFDFILENQTKAVEYIDRLIEKDPVYETDRAFPELELNMLTCRENTDSVCFENFQQMLNKYHDTSIGSYPEYFVTTFVLPGMANYFSNSDNETLHQQYLEVLEELSDRPGPLGISAMQFLEREY